MGLLDASAIALIVIAYAAGAWLRYQLLGSQAHWSAWQHTLIGALGLVGIVALMSPIIHLALSRADTPWPTLSVFALTVEQGFLLHESLASRLLTAAAPPAVDAAAAASGRVPAGPASDPAPPSD